MMFKECSGCGQHWLDRDEFLRDPMVSLIGYQVNFDNLNTGFFMFNHTKAKCLTTLSLHAGLFRDLYHGEVYHERLTGLAKCPGYCLRVSKLLACPEKCECSFVREVMQIVLGWPKVEAA